VKNHAKHAVLTAGTLIAFGASTIALSAGTGWFGGIGTARPALEFESAKISGSVSDSYASRKLYGAYRFSRNWGLEMGADLGYQNARDVGLIDPEAYVPGLRPRGWELSGTGTWSFGQKFGVIGRLGAYRGEVDVNPNQQGSVDGRTRATFGLGMKYDFTQNFRLQGGWDRYRLGATSDTGDQAIDLLSIGLKYKF
jgi:Outer membrane protein beta-barrel domain